MYNSLKRNSLLFSLLLLNVISVFAQTDHCIPQSILKKHVAPTEQDKKHLHEREEAFEREFQLVRGLRTSTSEKEIIIPVVVHIIHTNGSENMSDEEVHQSIATLNSYVKSDHSEIGDVVPSFKDIIANNLNVTFRLAERDPQDNITTGINRVYSSYTADGLKYEDNIKKDFGWDRKSYLNIYVVRFIENAAGFAYYPTSVDHEDWAYLDGVMIRASAMNTATLAHEVGHWLNLKHVWGDEAGFQESESCNHDDLVDDTPNTLGNHQCSLDAVSCGSVDNVQNIMDYTSSCRLMFTRGQGVRMIAALNSTFSDRYYLWSNENLKRIFPTLIQELTFSGNQFEESYEQEGTVGNNIQLELSNVEFAVSSGVLQIDEAFTFQGLPQGLSAEIEVLSPTKALLKITGEAEVHHSQTDYVASFELMDAALKSGNASNVIGYKKGHISFIFYDDTYRPVRISEEGSQYVCNGWFVDSGSLTGNYSAQEEYTITLYPKEADKAVKVFFEHLDVSVDDSLFVYNGTSTDVTQLKDSPYAGSFGMPTEFIPNNEEGALTFRFKSNSIVSGEGWEAFVTCIENDFVPPLKISQTTTESICGVLFTDSGGFNRKYSTSENETLTLRPSEQGKAVALTFEEFDLVNLTDYLYVFNGVSDQYEQVAGSPFTGKIDELELMADNAEGALTFQFVSGRYSETSLGWTAAVQCVENPYITPLLISEEGTVTSCNIRFKDAGAEAQYQNNEDYTLTILPSGVDNAVTLAFNKFELGLGNDNLYVYNGSSKDAPQVEGSPFKGKLQPFELKADNVEGALTFHFVSDGSYTGQGWDAEVACIRNIDYMDSVKISATESASKCSMLFTDTGGRGDNYGNDEDDVITLFPSDLGKSVQVAFDYFETETIFDKLYVYDGISVNAAQVAGSPFSGNIENLVVNASNSYGALTFSFISDFETNGRGWMAFVNCIDDNNVVPNCINDISAPVPNIVGEYLPVFTGNCPIVSIPAPTAEDTCEGTITGTTDMSQFPIRKPTTIQWIYTDSKGNTSTQLQKVIVQAPINTELFAYNGILKAKASEMSYQWIDCETELPVEGAIHQSFTPEQTDHNYYVEISNGECTLISACHNVDEITAINLNNEWSGLQLFPNPVESMLHIKSSYSGQNYMIQLTDVMGKVVLHQKLVKPELDLDHLPSGVYHLMVIDGKVLEVRKVVKL